MLWTVAPVDPALAELRRRQRPDPQLFVLLLGGKAEYFNAHATLKQLTVWLHGQPPAPPMIAGQERLGVWALPLATLVLFSGPLLVALVRAGTGGRGAGRPTHPSGHAR